MGPLQGVKIVDLSVMISGPLATMMLADQGADVVKVEAPGLGDVMRFLGSHKGGVTGIFVNNNRGKRGLVVDMKTAEGRDVLRSLVADADVLVQNFRPGAMARLGLDATTALELNPRLIYVSISGFGSDGPQSTRRVYDNVIQAASGLASVQTDPATGVPTLFRTLLCDKVTAYTAAQAITAALYAQASGRSNGQHIELAMLDAAIAFMWPDSAMDAALLDDDVQRMPTIGANYSITPLADGHATMTMVTDAEFHGVCSAFGRPDLAHDPRFSQLGQRMQNIAELVTILRDLAAATTVDEFLTGAQRYDVPASRINSLDDLPHDPQVEHNQVFIERVHAAAGTVREPRPAPRFSATPALVSRPAPGYGEHSDEIVSALGFDAADLRARGIIA